MNRSNFRNLKVWDLARILARDLYRATQGFPRAEMFGLTQQVRRAAVSLLCNIAEGQGRTSDADARRFAVIARGSLLEIEAQLVIAADLDYIDQEHAEALIEQSIQVTKMVNALIRSYDP